MRGGVAFILVVVIAVSTVMTSTLLMSDVSILLSYGSSGKQLSATGPNCFYWSANPQILAITHLDEDKVSPGTTASMKSCSHNVLVQPVGFSSERVSTMVYARDSKTGETLTTEVFVEQIFQLQLLTTVRKLHVGELGMLRIQALDFSENVFSSVSGLQFEWSTEDSSILRLLPLNSPLGKLKLEEMSLEDQQNLEKHHSILGMGTGVGKTKLSVRFSHPEIEEIVQPRVEVDFFVVDKFMLNPGEILYIIPESKVEFELVRILPPDNSRSICRMPYESFVWEHSDESVGSIDRLYGIFESYDKVGFTNFRVYDKNFEINEAKGLIYVVEPKYVHVKLVIRDRKKKNIYSSSDVTHLSQNPANLIIDTKYDLEIELFDKDYNLIFMTSNIAFDLRLLSTAAYDKVDISEERNILETKQLGRFVLEVTVKTKRYFLQNQQEFVIYPKVQILNSLLLLPEEEEGDDEFRKVLGSNTDNEDWVFERDEVLHLPHDVNVAQELYLKNIGGSGQFHSYVVPFSYEEEKKDSLSAKERHGQFEIIRNHTSHNILSVLDERRSIFLSRSIGKVRVVIVDMENLNNYATKIVEISNPHRITFLESVREVSVDEVLCIPVGVENSHGNFFANFTKLNLTFIMVSTNRKDDQDDENVYEYVPSKNRYCHQKHLEREKKRKDDDMIAMRGFGKRAVKCQFFAFEARKVGFTSIHVKYVRQAFRFGGSATTRTSSFPSSSLKILQDSIDVASYNPFELHIHDVSNVHHYDHSKFVKDHQPIVLALGSSIVVELVGGPTRWSHVTPNSKVRRNVKLETTKWVEFIEDFQDRNLFFFRCLDYGSQLVRFRLENHIRNDMYAIPTRLLLTRSFSCQAPHHMEVVPYFPGAFSEKMEPFSQNENGKLIYNVKNSQKLPLKLFVFSNSDEEFLNVSTLEIEWHLRSLNLGALLEEDSENNDERYFDISNEVGKVAVKGEVLGYDLERIGKDENVNLRHVGERFPVSIVDEIDLKITSSVSIQFYCGRRNVFEVVDESTRTKEDGTCGRLDLGFYCNFDMMMEETQGEEDKKIHLMFLHEENSIMGRIQGGQRKRKGFLLAPFLNDTNLAGIAPGRVQGKKKSPSSDVEEEEEGSERVFVVYPQKTFGEGSFEVLVHDSYDLSEGKKKKKKKKNKDPLVRATVKLSDVYDVKIEGSHFVEVKKTIVIQVAPMDSLGNLFDPTQVNMMNYMVQMEDEEEDEKTIINMKDCKFGRFEIYGKKVGKVSLLVSVRNGFGKRVVSNSSFVIYVYPPFELLPEDGKLMLIPGSIFQIQTKGGPPVDQFHLDISTKYDLELKLLDDALDTGITEKQFAVIDERGLITAGNYYGSAMINIKKIWNDYDDEDGEVFAELNLPLYIVRLTSIVTSNPFIRMYENKMIPFAFFGQAKIFDIQKHNENMTDSSESALEKKDSVFLSPIFLQTPHVKNKFSFLNDDTTRGLRSRGKKFVEIYDKFRYEKDIPTPPFVHLESLPEKKTAFVRKNQYENLQSKLSFNSEYDKYEYEVLTAIYLEEKVKIFSSSLLHTDNSGSRCSYSNYPLRLPPNSFYILKTNVQDFNTLDHSLYYFPQTGNILSTSTEQNFLKVHDKEESSTKGRKNLMKVIETFENEGNGILVLSRKGTKELVVQQSIVVDTPTFMDVSIISKGKKKIDDTRMVVLHYDPLFKNKDITVSLEFKNERGEPFDQSSILKSARMISMFSNDPAVVWWNLVDSSSSEVVFGRKINFEAMGSGVSTIEISAFGVPYYLKFIVKPKIIPNEYSVVKKLRGGLKEVQKEPFTFLYVGESIYFEAIGSVRDETGASWSCSGSEYFKFLNPTTGYVKAIASTGKYQSYNMLYHSPITGKTESFVRYFVRKLTSALFSSPLNIRYEKPEEEEFEEEEEEEKILETTIIFQLYDESDQVYDERKRSMLKVNGKRGRILNSNVKIDLTTTNPEIVKLGETKYTENGYYECSCMISGDKLDLSSPVTTVGFEVRVWTGEEENYIIRRDFVPTLTITVVAPKKEDEIDDDEGEIQEEDESEGGSSIIFQIMVAICTICCTLFLYNLCLSRQIMD